MLSPFAIVEHGTLFVCRDDLIPGGTKRRALDRLIPQIDATDFAYAGTIFGHGALALAHACADHGKRAHLFLAAHDPHHPMIAALQSTGAKIHTASPLPVAEIFTQAKEWAKANNARLFPLAFDDPAFHETMVQALKSLDVSSYPELWCGAVSGTLARALRAAFPQIPLNIVSTTRTGTADYTAPEKYHQPAKSPPPFPSCPYTDAKLWQFAVKHAKPGALIWNTAG